MRAVVVGADGFVGRWLVEHLVASGDSVHRVVGPRYAGSPGEGLTRLDIRDAADVARMLRDTAPTVVYDLAGISHRGERDDPRVAVEIGVHGGLNLLIGGSGLDPAPRLVFVSTGYVYRGTAAPTAETSPVQPGSVYAASKLAAEAALRAMAPALGMEVVIARPFNHIGPGQADSFLVPSLARRLVEAAPGEAPIQVRDANAVRDFTDVRDVVTAYRILGKHGRPGEVYNVASGVGTSVADIASAMAGHAGIDSARLVLDPAHPAGEPTILIGDAGKLEGLGWARRHRLDDTLAEVIEGYRAAVS